MAKDPICGMTVNEATALCAERDGQAHYFCSEHCRQKFIGQAPRAKSIPLTVTETGQGCCDEAKAESPRVPGDCCGGKGSDHSQPEHGAAAVKPSSAAKYFCPMCPGVAADKPGDCPQCGMALERNPAWVAPAAGKTIYTCPCALGLATPMSVMVGVGRGAQSGVLIRNAESIEMMEKVTTLVVDKTGRVSAAPIQNRRVMSFSS